MILVRAASGQRQRADVIPIRKTDEGAGMKMQFIELTGKTLLDVVTEGEIDLEQLHDAGVTGDSILRINRHGEIELRCKSHWMLVGGLIGNFEERLTRLTGLEWAD